MARRCIGQRVKDIAALSPAAACRHNVVAAIFLWRPTTVAAMKENTPPLVATNIVATLKPLCRHRTAVSDRRLDNVATVACGHKLWRQRRENTDLYRIDPGGQSYTVRVLE